MQFPNASRCSLRACEIFDDFLQTPLGPIAVILFEKRYHVRIQDSIVQRLSIAFVLNAPVGWATVRTRSGRWVVEPNLSPPSACRAAETEAALGRSVVRAGYFSVEV